MPKKSMRPRTHAKAANNNPKVDIFVLCKVGLSGMYSIKLSSYVIIIHLLGLISNVALIYVVNEIGNNRQL